MKTLAGEIERLQQTLDKKHDSLYFARLADYLIQSNRIPEAIDICKRGLELYPQYANAHFVLGHCYYLIHDYDAAESEFNKVLLHDPQHLNTHHFQAKIMKERGWQNAYLLWLKRILVIDPLDQLAQSMMEDSTQEDREKLETRDEAAVSFGKKSEVPGDMDSDNFKEIERTFADSSEEVSDTTGFEEITTDEKEALLTAPAKEEDEKRYEFILDDIFKDEVAQEEPMATGMAETTDEAEAMVDESLEDEDEIVKQIRGRVEQFEREDTKSDLETQADELPEEAVTHTEKPTEISMEDKGRIAREVFGDENNSEPTEVMEETDALPPKQAPAASPVEEKSAVSPVKEPIVTSTLGEIYAAQGHFAKAIGVYEILLRKNPSNESYKVKIEELKRKLAEAESQNQ